MSQFREITCREAWKEMVNFQEGDLSPEIHQCIDMHLGACANCRGVYDGSHNVVRLLADERVVELPSGFSRRLQVRLTQNFK
jgi:predicted anti-sigma-YlaC factor YlaD